MPAPLHLPWNRLTRMTAQGKDSQGLLAARTLAWFSPNLPVFLLIFVGLVSEVLLLGRVDDNIYRGGRSLTLLAFFFHLWFWMTTGWTLWVASIGLASLTRRWPAALRLLFRGGLLTAASLGVLLVFASWGLYLRSGQFASIEAFEFALLNRQMIWLYLLQAERTDLVGFVLLVVVVLGSLPKLTRWLLHARWPVAPSPVLNAGRVAVWGVLTLMLFGSIHLARSEGSDLRRKRWKDAVARRMDPVFTLAASVQESWLGEKIEPCLRVEALRPIAKEAWTVPAATKPRPSIVFVAIESLRHDVVGLRHQDREVMPALNRLAEAGLHLTRAYAQSTHSDYSDVCVASSLFPLRTRTHHFYRPSDPWPKTLIYDLLKPQGYATAIISAQNEGWGAMDCFLKSPNLDLFYDSQASGLSTRVASADVGFAQEVRSGELRAGKLDDACVTDKAIAWVADQVKQGQPFFLSLNFQSSHFPYELSEASPRPFRPSTIDFDVSFTSYPAEKTEVVRNAYYNALHYIDRQLERLVASLREMGQLENTILVVYGENGEAFHENGAVTHAQNPVEPALRVACVVHAPQLLKARVDDYPSELIDIVPTTLGLLKWPAHPNFQGIDLLSRHRPPVEERLLFFHTENPLTRADALLLAGRWKLSHDRNTHQVALYDLDTDPAESSNLVDRHPELAGKLRNLLAQWRSEQLAYHHYPFYFEKYYPPSPPSVHDASRREALVQR